MIDSQAIPSARRRPVSVEGIAPGSTTWRSCSARVNPDTDVASISFGSTPRTPECTLRYIGNSTPSATSSTFGSSPMPNQRMNSGTRPRCGSVRSICTGGSTSSPPQREPRDHAEPDPDDQAEDQPGRDPGERDQQPLGQLPLRVRSTAAVTTRRGEASSSRRAARSTTRAATGRSGRPGRSSGAGRGGAGSGGRRVRRRGRRRGGWCTGVGRCGGPGRGHDGSRDSR